MILLAHAQFAGECAQRLAMLMTLAVDCRRGNMADAGEHGHPEELLQPAGHCLHHRGQRRRPGAFFLNHAVPAPVGFCQRTELAMFLRSSAALCFL